MKKKKAEIYEQHEHLLNLIWASGKGEKYNGKQWKPRHQWMFVEALTAFELGCELAGGKKWRKRLHKAYKAYKRKHGECVNWTEKRLTR